MESPETAKGPDEENVFKTPDLVNQNTIEDSVTLEPGEKRENNQSDGDSEKMEITEDPSGFAKANNEFLTPSSLPPPRREEEFDKMRSPVLMTFKSKFAIPADIYKAKPKVAAFISFSPRPKTSTTDTAQISVEESKVKTEPQQKCADIKSTKPLQAKFTYEEPDWGLEPIEGRYSLEILKMGAIVGKIELSKKEFYIVGRLQDCDIIMEHPSISRYHSVLQYGAPEEDCENVELQKDGTPGFYVYDLGSTHGTIINKKSVSSKTYYRIKVGHVIKFGGSTRMYILQGPENDKEEETKESATELRAMNKMKLKKKQELEKRMLGEDSSGSDEEDGSKKQEKPNEDTGITWGMLEDAVASSSDEEEEQEEEGDTLDMHPDAVTVTLKVKKDPFYVKDPQKALKNLYEREKMELEFDCTERRSGQWNVRLCLPVTERNGKPIYAEASATGKKKVAIAQCSLEACRILEKHGMFHYKDHHKQKLKQWEKDDYYDSDEDEFQDRTGDLEKKRKQRMKRIGKAAKIPQKVETYETLSKQHKELEDEVKDIEAKLSKDKQVTCVSATVADPLDAFMQQIKSGKALDTTTRKKLKHRLFEAKKELIQVFKLAEIARPSSLPPLQSSVKKFSFIGQMKGKRKFLAPVVRHIQQPQVLEDGRKDEIILEEEEEEKEIPDSSANKDTVKNDINNEPKKIKTDLDSIVINERTSTEGANSVPIMTKITPKPPEATATSSEDIKLSRDAEIKTVVKQNDQNNKVNETSWRKRVLGPTLPPELRDKLIKEQNNEESTEDGSKEPKKRKRRVRKPKPQSSKSPSKAIPEYSDDPKYAMWLPPEDQKGDGKTSLNDKLGY